jgi:hypothetical protein
MVESRPDPHKLTACLAWGSVMAIRYYLDGKAFDPEAVQVMSEAFTSVCTYLGLADRDDPATRLVAERIIAHAERGITNRSDLYALVIAEFQQSGK